MTETKITKKERKEVKKHERVLRQEKEIRLKNVKRFGLLIGALMFLGLVIGLISFFRISVSSVEKNKSVDKIAAGDWVKGNPNAKLVVIEYSDFQCPACAVVEPIVSEMVEKYGDRVAFAYRHFPLAEIHPLANLAARASEAAGMQGKFWEMHAVLFERQTEWVESKKTMDNFVAYAKEIGINVDKFKSDINSKEVKGLVKADYVSGLERRINSTPTFYIKGMKVKTPPNGGAFSKLLDEELAGEL